MEGEAKVVMLREPVRLASGETLDRLAIRPPSVGDVLAAHKTSGDDAEREFQLISRLSGVNPEDLRRVGFADYRAALKELLPFLE